MKGWRSYLLWEGIPFWMLFLCFGFLSSVNCSFESKLLILNTNMPDWVGSHLGPILLATALGLVIAASVILFVVRITRPKTKGDWYMFAALTLVAIFLIFPSLFITMFGPAGISVTESRQQVAGK